MAPARARISDCDEDQLKNALKYIFMLIGIRGQNVPVGAEKEFIHRYLRAHYGGHTPEEMMLAFDMAVQGRLKIDAKDVKCYENFSAEYVARIMNAYRAWAREEARHLESHLPPIDETNRLEAPPTEINYRAEVEQAYRHFLSYGPEHEQIWPLGIHDQLVADGALKEYLWRRFVKQARREMLQEAYGRKSKAALVIQTMKESIERAKDSERAASAIAINQTLGRQAQEDIDELKAGTRDTVIENAAKRRVVREYFNELKGLKQATIYTTTPPQEERPNA